MTSLLSTPTHIVSECVREWVGGWVGECVGVCVSGWVGESVSECSKLEIGHSRKIFCVSSRKWLKIKTQL